MRAGPAKLKINFTRPKIGISSFEVFSYGALVNETTPIMANFSYQFWDILLIGERSKFKILIFLSIFNLFFIFEIS